MMGLCFSVCSVLVNEDDGVMFLCSLYERMVMMGLCFSVCLVLVNEDDGVMFFCIACMSGW